MPGVIAVGMAEIKVSRSASDVLTAIGLGSCIGVCLFDPTANVAGMVHVVLPEVIGAESQLPGKFAPTAIPALIAQMSALGATPSRFRAAIAGGAQLFSFSSGSTKLDIGRRNGEAVKAALLAAGLSLSACDIGGSSGRTLSMFVGGGRVRVKTIGAGERDLVHLSESSAVQRAS